MLKQINKVAVVEILLGVAGAILLINLLSMIFARSTPFQKAEESAEEAEEAEEFEDFAKGRARRAEKKKTRAANKMARIQQKIKQGKAQGKAGRIRYDDPEPNEQPEYEEPEQEEEDFEQAEENAEEFEQAE